MRAYDAEHSIRQYHLAPVSPNLMLAKVSRYTVTSPDTVVDVQLQYTFILMNERIIISLDKYILTFLAYILRSGFVPLFAFQIWSLCTQYHI